MIEENLGVAIRNLRENRGLSLRMLAESAGFSAAFLSQVENGQASPSISSMEKIAHALGVTLGEFFSQAQESPSPIIRATERGGIASEWSRARIEVVGKVRPGRKLEASIITLEPGGRSGKHPQPHSREQFAITLSGEVSLALGEETFVLSSGDAVTLAPEMARRWENISSQPTQVLIVSVPVR